MQSLIPPSPERLLLWNICRKWRVLAKQKPLESLSEWKQYYCWGKWREEESVVVLIISSSLIYQVRRCISGICVCVCVSSQRYWCLCFRSRGRPLTLWRTGSETRCRKPIGSWSWNWRRPSRSSEGPEKHVQTDKHLHTHFLPQRWRRKGKKRKKKKGPESVFLWEMNCFFHCCKQW